jgi:hypothetical protein
MIRISLPVRLRRACSVERRTRVLDLPPKIRSWVPLAVESASAHVTPHPTAEWIARQITEAFPWNEAPRYLIRDQDRVYGAVVTRRFRAMGIRDKPIAAGSPWQNGLRN